MRAVLISIGPEWCEKILNGEKTIEVRKSAPKPPFKVVVYCTKGKPNLYIPQEYNCFPMDEASQPYFAEEPILQECDNLANGKVVAEFVCNNVDDFSEWEYDYPSLLRHIDLYAGTKGDYRFLDNYLKGNKKGYALHITDLKIYDTPKELSEVYKPEESCCFYNKDLGRCDSGYDCKGCVYNDLRIKRPPQSWQYIEEE